MDGFMSSDEVFSYQDAVAFLKFSGRKPNSVNVYRTIRRRYASFFCVFSCFFAFIYLLCPRNDKRLESVAMYDNRCEEIA